MQPVLSSFTHLTYTKVLKPILFLLDPEVVHNHFVSTGSVLGKSRAAQNFLHWCWGYDHPSLVKNIDGVTFPNPVGLSAGFDYNANLIDTLPAMGFGFHTIGTITLEPYEGNPRPRLARLPRSQALVVNKGLKNIGAKAIIRKLRTQQVTIPVGISIASTNKHFESEQEQIADITKCFELFEASTVQHSYYELNISCPNTFGGEPFTTPKKLERLMKAIDQLKLSRPLYVKMPIDQSADETRALLKTLVPHHVQGVIFGNLTKDKSNPDVHSEDAEKWKTLKGNLSGKPTWQRSNKWIQLTKAEFGSRFTIIGTGGIFDGHDALEKMELGADLVQLITGMVYEGPQVIGQINKYLADSLVYFNSDN